MLGSGAGYAAHLPAGTVSPAIIHPVPSTPTPQLMPPTGLEVSETVVSLLNDIIESAEKARECGGGAKAASGRGRGKGRGRGRGRGRGGTAAGAATTTDKPDWNETMRLVERIERTAGTILMMARMQRSAIEAGEGGDGGQGSVERARLSFGELQQLDKKRKRDGAMQRFPDSDEDDTNFGSESERGIEGSPMSLGTVTLEDSARIAAEAVISCEYSGANPKWTSPPLTAELEERLDIIFFTYLAKICSNFDSVDKSGNRIHMTLVARKMRFMSHTQIFECFKFKPTPFADGFMAELGAEDPDLMRQPGALIKAYLFRQKYLARYNKENKKYKTKGAPVLAVEAKKGEDGSWIFKEFEKTILMPTRTVVNVGQVFIYKPEIRDPQLGERPATFEFYSLPKWLRWVDNVLRGSPTETDESCEIHVTATYGHVDLDQNVVLRSRFFLEVRGGASTMDEVKQEEVLT
ncbi:hypothetical protein HDU96_005859 [Phlyctochytrium bullatum]|nr:hypothetical protein HDU96_005859 [Phlyctochytrium bullatum]